MKLGGYRRVFLAACASSARSTYKAEILTGGVDKMLDMPAAGR